MTTYTKKAPVRGDRVIDHNRVIKKEGIIISGIFEHTLVPTEEDICEDALVSFSHSDRHWYSKEQLEDCWVEELQAFVVNADD